MHALICFRDAGLIGKAASSKRSNVGQSLLYRCWPISIHDCNAELLVMQVSNIMQDMLTIGFGWQALDIQNGS